MTDRQTDGQTDRILIAIPRLHYMQRGKNDIKRPVKNLTLTSRVGGLGLEPQVHVNITVYSKYSGEISKRVACKLMENIVVVYVMTEMTQHGASGTQLNNLIERPIAPRYWSGGSGKLHGKHIESRM